MDIAKYMVTALLLSTIFAEMNEHIILYMVEKMNTLQVSGLILLIAIVVSIFFKYQDHKMAKQE